MGYTKKVMMAPHTSIILSALPPSSDFILFSEIALRCPLILCLYNSPIYTRNQFKPIRFKTIRNYVTCVVYTTQLNSTQADSSQYSYIYMMPKIRPKFKKNYQVYHCLQKSILQRIQIVENSVKA